MTLTRAEGETMRVRFDPYELQMPKDIVGKEVVIHGKSKKEVISVDMLRHYAEDEGKKPEEVEAITEPKNKLTFLADGVVIKG